MVDNGTARRRPGRPGFTLIELMVVLLVMGLLLVVASPAYERVLPGLGLHAAARDLAGTLRAARLEAIGSGREVAVLFDPAAGVYRRDAAATAQALPEGAAVEVVAASSELSADGVARIRFFPDGASTGGRVTLARGGTSLRIDVDWLTGHVAIDR